MRISQILRDESEEDMAVEIASRQTHATNGAKKRPTFRRTAEGRSWNQKASEKQIIEQKVEEASVQY